MIQRTELFALDGKVALITGAARGLGFEMARSLAAFGAEVILNGRDTASLQEAAEHIRAEGGRAHTLVFDVAAGDSVCSAIYQIAEQYGKLDILINNVGIRDRRGIWEISTDDFSHVLDVNLTACFQIAREAAKLMIARKEGGRIINIGTAAATFALALDPSYLAAKAGVAAITRSLAAELGGHAITVNTIVPGAFPTETNKALLASQSGGRHRGQGVLGRTGEPADIGGAAVFLASRAGGYVTGTELIVDGGFRVAI